MQLKCRHAVLVPLAAAMLLPGSASPDEVDEQDASYTFRNFGDSDHVHVMSHFGRYALDLRRGTKLFLQFNHETVTVPGVEAAAGTQEAVDAITTASRPIRNGADAFRSFSKDRNEFQGDIGNRRVKVGYYVSKESDYFAQQVRTSLNRDFFEENLNLKVGSSYGWDAIDPLQDEDTATGKDHRTTWNCNAVATQILSPTLLVRVGGDLTLVHGLQHNPYRNVYAGGGPVPERHPDARTRTDAFIRVSKYLKNRSSLRASYIAYRDDWGVTSHTLDGRLSQYVTEDVLVRYRYRFYTQSGADFYREEYADPTGIDGYRTADYRLQPFNAHLFGAEIDMNLGLFRARPDVLRHLHLTLGYQRYFNTGNFSANILESGLNFTF